MKGHGLLLTLGLSSLLVMSAHAQNLLVDGDFSVTPGSGTPTNTVTSQGNNSYQYDATGNAGGGNTHNGGLTDNVGGAGGWSFQNGGVLSGVTQTGAAIYVVQTSTTGDNWIAPAGAANTNGYVAQLDTISTAAAWITGNAIYQTVTVTSGDTYALTFSINTETGGGKSNLSGADVMVTNATITNSTGSSGTVLTSSATNKNAASYGNVTGYQYEVDTTGQANGATATTWATYTLDFTATSGTVQIAFADDPISANSNISLEDLSLTAVPEPREWGLLMLLGAMGLIAVRKLRSGPKPVAVPVAS